MQNVILIIEYFLNPIFLLVLIVFTFITIVFIIFKAVLAPRRTEYINQLINQGRIRQAVRLAKQMLIKNSNDMNAHYFLGKCYLKEGKNELALMEYKHAAKINHFTKYIKEVDLREQLAELYTGFGYLEEAQKELLLLSQRYPDNAIYLYKIGKIFDKRGIKESAVSYFQKSIDVDPENAQAHFLMGKILYEEKKQQDSREALSKAIKYDPQNTAAYFFIGMLHREAREFSNALAAFEKASRNKEYKNRSILERGYCYLEQKDFGKAAIELERVINLIESETNLKLHARYLLAVSFEKMRKITKAIDQWEVIFQVKPSFKDVSEKLSTYQDLRNDDKMKDFLTANDDEFAEMTRKVIEILNLNISDIKKVHGGFQIVAFESAGKWRNAKKTPRLIRVSREMTEIDENIIRNLHESMKKVNAFRSVMISTSNFTKQALAFAQTRPIDLIDRTALQDLLKKVSL